MWPRRVVVDVEDAFVGREGEAVGQDEIVGEEAQRAEVGGHPVDPGILQVPLLGRGRAGPRVGEIDAAVGADDNVVRPVESAALKAVGDDGDAAVRFLAGDAAAVVLAGDESSLQVAGQAVGAIGRFEKQRNAASRLVLHATVVVDVAEQEVAALLPPQRSLGRALSPTEAIGEVLDRLRGRNDLLELRRKLLDARRQVVVGHGEPSHRLSQSQTLGLRRTRGKGPAMEFGASIFFTDYSITPAELAVALEERGFDSVWAAEHSHIPVPRKTPAPGGGELHKRYYDVMDPFVTLTAAACVTKKLKIGTGIALVIQRDTIQTAKLVASIDQVSGGRFLFGIGGGWNQEEIENHDTVFATRMQKMREQMEAMKAIWTQSKPEYHGEIVKFDTMMTWPKPVQKPHPPIILGGAFPWAARRAVRYGDGWYPNAASGEPEDYIPAFRQMAQEAGRDPEVAVAAARRRAGRSRQAEAVPRPRGRRGQRHADVGQARRDPADPRPLGRPYPPAARIIGG